MKAVREVVIGSRRSKNGAVMVGGVLFKFLANLQIMPLSECVVHCIKDSLYAQCGWLLLQPTLRDQTNRQT